VVDHQLRQNQLVLSLNQSYFQLVTNQNALIDRFNRLEQLVLGGGTAANNGSVAMESYGQRPGPPSTDAIHSVAPAFSLFTGTQSPFNLNNSKIFFISNYIVIMPPGFCIQVERRLAVKLCN